MVRNAVVFISGVATMAIQITAVRMLSPWVGASTMVWATIIGLSLLAMSCGYWLGGKAADRWSGPVLAFTLGGAASATAVAPLIVRHVMPRADLGVSDAASAVVTASAVGYGLSFFVPALLLGFTLPFATRVAVDSVDRAGGSAGRVYGISTVGSIAGTLLAALVLLQWLGSRATLWVIALGLTVAAFASIRLRVHTAPPGSTVPLQSSASFSCSRMALFVVFIEGVATMATEMTSARMLAPFFGTSQVVWAIVIAVTMSCIALGSWSGGRLVDRRPSRSTLQLLLLASTVAVAALPFAAAPLMRLSTGSLDEANVPLVAATFIGTMMLLSVPMVILGMIPPAMVRLSMADVGSGGRTAGRLYAASTAGALVGTFASALWLVPLIGTRRTFLVVALLLAGAAVLVVRQGTIRLVVPVLVATLIVVPAGVVKPQADTDILLERESDFQFLQVTQDDEGIRRLRLNEGWAVHSIHRPETVLTGQYWDNFLLLPDLLGRAPASMVIVGNAAGTTARAYSTYFPQVDLVGVEIDSDVTKAGRTYFDMGAMPVAAEDGRPFLARRDEKWDLMQVDAYRQPYIPFYVATREFFALARDRLTVGGILAINVGVTPGDDSVSDSIAATMRAEFPVVLRYRAEEYNDILVGVNDARMSLAEVRTRLRASAGPVSGLADDFAERVELVQPASALVFTDDRAPIEWMTNGMIFDEAGRQG
jgi:spermidine synthase